MTIVRIKDAPFSKKEVRHLLAMGIEEADWGHPQVKLDDPIKYFKERIRLNDDPSLQMRKPMRNLPSLRGVSLRDDYYRRVILGTAPEPRKLRLPGPADRKVT